MKRTCRDISRHPDGYINVTMDSIGCLNNITYPGPTEYSMYKCQNFGTARQTAPAPAGQRGDDPIVARTASMSDGGNVRTAPYARRHRRSNAPGGICWGSRQRTHWPGNDRTRMQLGVPGQKNNISGCDIHKTNSIPLCNACPNDDIAPIGRFQVHGAPKLRPAEGHQLFY